MKNEDQMKKSLYSLGKLRFKNNKSDYELGIGNMAEIFLRLVSCHANSFEYKDALNTLNEMARNAEKDFNK
jgi:hypothetical protein